MILYPRHLLVWMLSEMHLLPVTKEITTLMARGNKKQHKWSFPWNNQFSATALSLSIQWSTVICLLQLEACVHPFFNELRDLSTRLPNGRPLPPLFNFKPQGYSLSFLFIYLFWLDYSLSLFLLLTCMHELIWPIPCIFNVVHLTCRAERSNSGASVQTDTRARPKAMPLPCFVDCNISAKWMEPL
jgi:hypothetical protein